MYKGQRPSRHIRRVRTKYGRKIRIINPRIKRRSWMERLGLATRKAQQKSLEQEEKAEQAKIDKEIEDLFRKQEINKITNQLYPDDQRAIGAELLAQKLRFQEEANIQGTQKRINELKELQGRYQEKTEQIKKELNEKIENMEQQKDSIATQKAKEERKLLDLNKALKAYERKKTEIYEIAGRIKGAEDKDEVAKILRETNLDDKGEEWLKIMKLNKDKIPQDERAAAEKLVTAITRLKESITGSPFGFEQRELEAGKKMLALPEDKLIKPHEAADILGVTEAQLAEWAKYNESWQKPGVKKGGLIKKDIPLLLPTSEGLYSQNVINMFKRSRVLNRLTELDKQKEIYERSILAIQGKIKSKGQVYDEALREARAEQVANRKANKASKVPSIDTLQKAVKVKKRQLDDAREILKRMRDLNQ